MKKSQIDKLFNTARFVVAEAKRLGATDCDVTIEVGDAVSTEVRLKQVESLEGAQSCSVGFRAFIGQRSASMSTSDMRRRPLTKLVRDTIAMARDAQEDAFAGLPDAKYLATATPDLALCDDAIAKMPVERKIELAMQMEAAALAHDPRIQVGRSTSFSDGTDYTVYANSRGFVGGYGSSYVAMSTQVVAKDNQGMQTGGWQSVSRTLAGLGSPEEVGKVAAQRTLRHLGARKVKSQEVPVVFDPQMAARLISQFVGAAAGNAIYQKRSFLVGKLGQQVAASKVTIIDDGLMPGGLGSKPFDGEGLPTSKRTIIDRGSLTMYLMGSYSARKLGAEPNGGSLSNLYLEAGDVSPEDIIGSVKNGLYLTAVSGPGFNSVSGDYSMGASGIWIEDGKLAYPVEEITVASNILEMFANIEMVGNDLEFRSSVNAPTIKIARMMVAGE